MTIFLEWLFRKRPVRGQVHGTSPVTGHAPEITYRVTIKEQDLSKLKLIPRTFDPDGDETDLMWYGYGIVDQDGNFVTYKDRRLRELGTFIFNVAGTSYRREALQNACFEPLRTVKLIPEDNNPHDLNAVAVWDETGKIMVGYVPREDAQAVRTTIAESPECSGLVIAHSIKGGKRVGLTVMFGLLARE